MNINRQTSLKTCWLSTISSKVCHYNFTLSPGNEDIFTEVEATYKASLLKKKARSYNTPETLLDFHTRAKKTIEVLTRNMIQADVSLDRIFEYYDEITRQNVIKMLLRCKLLYEARVDVRKILLLIIKKEETHAIIMSIKEGKVRKSKEEIGMIINECLRLISRLISCINNFKHEHKIFKGQFLFKGQDYQQTLVQHRNMI